MKTTLIVSLVFLSSMIFEFQTVCSQLRTPKRKFSWEGTISTQTTKRRRTKKKKEGEDQEQTIQKKTSTEENDGKIRQVNLLPPLKTCNTLPIYDIIDNYNLDYQNHVDLQEILSPELSFHNKISTLLDWWKNLDLSRTAWQRRIQQIVAKFGELTDICTNFQTTKEVI